MTTGAGWEPLRPPTRPGGPTGPSSAPPRPPTTPVVPPFTRLARVQALSSAGDAMVAVALAGSLFFNIEPDAARSKVALYLLFTLAPFAVVSPVIGPMLDRMAGGRRAAVIIIGFGRALLALLMAFQLDSLLLFPLAFLFLVLQKAYGVSRSALVPVVVTSDAELVEANAKLGLIAGIMGFLAGAPAVLIGVIVDTGPVVLASLVFVAQGVAAFALPSQAVAADAATDEEKAELAAPVVRVAAMAMAALRATVGFLTFAIAFWFRTDGVATAWFGAVIVCSVLGTLGGNAVGGAIRRRASEERMLVGALLVTAIAGLLAMLTATVVTAALFAGTVGFATAVGRLAFDALVQREAPDANRGRAFARFETRFQLVWVVAAFIPVIVPMTPEVAFLFVVLLAGVGGLLYGLNTRRLRRGDALPDPLEQRVVRTVATRYRSYRDGRRVKRATLPPPEPSQRRRLAGRGTAEPTAQGTGGPAQGTSRPDVAVTERPRVPPPVPPIVPPTGPEPGVPPPPPA